MRALIGTCAVLVATLAPAVGQEDGYRVGVAATDITWHVMGDRLRQHHGDLPDFDPLTFSGLHSRVWAKAIVVDGPEGPFAFARADILMVTGDLYEAVVQRVRDRAGIPPERVLVAATHTHVANNGLFPHPAHSAVYRSFDPREQWFVAEGIADAIARAAADTRPAALAAGSGTVTLPAFNRRYTDREQQGSPPHANDPSRLDPELGVLRFDDADTGAPIAVLMNYGLHPVVLIDNPLVSADFVGWAERGVEEALGATAIWFTGAQGDQDPVHVRYSYPEAEWTGRIFAREAVRVAAALEPEPITRAAIVEKVIPVPEPGSNVVPTTGFFGPDVPLVGPGSLLIPTSVRLHAIELATADSSVALLSWPGEPIRDLGVAVKNGARALGFDRAYVLALANDWGGYWLTPEEYDRGLYERTLVFYGRDSAPYVLDHVLDLARALRTGTSPIPVPLPPNAAADRVLTEAIARAGMGAAPHAGRTRPLVSDEPSSIVAQPTDVERGQLVSLTWVGGSPDAPRGWIPEVVVVSYSLKEDGGSRVVAQEGTGDVLLYQSTPRRGEHRWTVVWQPPLDVPEGRYVFRTVSPVHCGPPWDNCGILAMEWGQFTVSACTCIEPGALSAENESDGVALSVAANYTAVPDGFRLLPERVSDGRAFVEVLLDGDVVDLVELTFVSSVEPVVRTITVHNLDGRDLPVTIVEPTERGSFRGAWAGPAGATFRLLSMEDAAGNRWHR